MRRLLSGWGNTAPTAGDVVRPTSADEVERLLGSGGATVARGLGRSYGDAAQCAGGLVVDCTALDTVLGSEVAGAGGADEPGWPQLGGTATCSVRAQAGVSLDALMRAFVPRGWFVPVTPGTRFVTMGGAIAADIHGKNHHRDGSFCAHVSSLRLATPTGTHVVSPHVDPELFWATAGGMGLTGVVVEATLEMDPVETAWMLVDTERAGDLEDCMARMTARDEAYRYSVAWIDCLARGRHLGRSVLTRGDHAPLEALPARARAGALVFDPRVRARVPVRAPGGLLNPLSVAAFNEAWYRRAPRRQVAHPEHMTTFFHPLDGVGAWNLLYGRLGFVQYQFVVLDDEAGEQALRGALERLSAGRVASFLAVLKRFGPAGAGPLSFPRAGWTLALDLPLGSAGLAPLLDGLDELVAGAGGRVYLAKDARLRPELLPAMYPRLDEWRAVRRRVDPGGVLVSDLARRLGIVEEDR